MAKTAIPKLTSDVRRVWLALIPVFVVSFLVGPPVLRERPGPTGTLALLVLVWVCYGACHVLLTWWAFRRLTGERLRTALLYAVKTESRLMQWMLRQPVLRTVVSGGSTVGWSVQMAFLAFVVTVILTVNQAARADPLVVVLGALAVIVCWFTVLVAYAVHYAREDARAGGLHFPGVRPDSFVEYAYLALMVSASFGTSDVQVLNAQMRRIVAGHTLVAFAFNTVIVAVVVSMLVGTLM